MHIRIIRQYLFLSCLSTMLGTQVLSAVYVSFLLKKGLNLLEVNLVNAVFFLTLFVCELPTGAFADTFGRKRCFVAACGLISASAFVYGSSDSFQGFICAEILAAIGFTFKSGAFQAWLVDNLKHHGYEGSLSKVFARESLLNQIGGGIGAIVGSYLFVTSMSLPWFVSSACMFCVMIAAQAIMREEYFTPVKLSWKKGAESMKAVAVTSFKYGREDKAVRFVLVITFVQIYAVQALNMYWQPFFKGYGLAEAHFGYLFAAMTVSLAAGAFWVSRIRAEDKEKRLILVSQAWVGLAVTASALAFNLPLLVAFFLLHEVGRGFWGPLKSSYLHERIPSHERATIVSFCAIAPHIGGAIGLVISGLIARYLGIAAAWMIGGIVLIVGALVVARNGRKAE